MRTKIQREQNFWAIIGGLRNYTLQCAQKDSLSICNSSGLGQQLMGRLIGLMFGGLHLEMERRCWDITWPVLDGQLHSLFGVYGSPGNSLGSSQRKGSKALLTCSQGFLNVKS